MDDARPVLLAVASSLGRLQVRMLRLSNQQLVVSHGRLARIARNHWTVGDLSPSSEWLEATPPRTSLSGAIAAVALAQVHLLSMIEAEGPIDRRLACRVVWHISCGGGWSAILLRLAAHLDVSLAASPLENPRRKPASSGNSSTPEPTGDVGTAIVTRWFPSEYAPRMCQARRCIASPRRSRWKRDAHQDSGRVRKPRQAT